MPVCYQCDKHVPYLFDDARGSCCTRLTKDEIEGNITDDPCGYCGDSQDPNDICRECFDSLSGAGQPAPDPFFNSLTFERF